MKAWDREKINLDYEDSTSAVSSVYKSPLQSPGQAMPFMFHSLFNDCC